MIRKLVHKTFFNEHVWAGVDLRNWMIRFEVNKDIFSVGLGPFSATWFFKGVPF